MASASDDSGGEEVGSALPICAAQWAVAQWTRVDGWKIRYREAGTGPTIVLVHGLGVSADYWWRNGPPLAAAGYRVLAPDLPGYGRSKGPRRGLSVVEQAEWLRRWAEVEGMERAVFVGHSLSCQTVLELAARQPSLVSGLVLAAPTGNPQPHRLLRQAWGLLLDVPRESIPLAVLVTKAYLQCGPIRYWHTWNQGAKHNPLPLLPHVHAPTLITVGTQDPVVLRPFVEALHTGLSRTRLAWVQDAAHALIYTHSEPFNRAVLDFVSEAVPRATR